MAHNEMKFEDFRIGETFFTATGEWVVTAVSLKEKIVIANKLDGSRESYFDHYDFGGCSKKPFSC